MPRGGYRPNAKGPKKGTKYRPTLEKEVERERLRAIIGPRLESMCLAQMDHAEGVKYLVKRDKAGQYKPITQDELEKLSPEDVVEVYDKVPSTQAFTELMNRYIDLPAKPKEEIDAKVTHRFLWGGE